MLSQRPQSKTENSPLLLDARESALGDELVGYAYSSRGEIYYWALAFLSAGITLVLEMWYPKMFLRLRFSPCTLDEADFVTFENSGLRRFQFMRVEELDAESCSESDVTENRNFVKSIPLDRRMIVCQGTRYVYNVRIENYEPIRFEQVMSTEKLANFQSTAESKAVCIGDMSAMPCLTSSQVETLTKRYGYNVIRIHVPAVSTLFVNELFHPFYLFQLFAVVLWTFENYVVFAFVIFIMAAASMAASIYEIRSNFIRIASLSKTSDINITVIRDGHAKFVRKSEVVPGDVVVVNSGIVSFDFVLLTGGAVVNESILTGESVPVYKVPFTSTLAATNIVDLDALPEIHKLSEGTEVCKVSSSTGPALGVVIRTGYGTKRGQLIKSVLWPAAVSFKFVDQSYKFIFFLATVAAVGEIFIYIRLMYIGMDVWEGIVRALDLITIIIPPALPLAMAVGTVISIERLKKKISIVLPQAV